MASFSPNLLSFSMSVINSPKIEETLPRFISSIMRTKFLFAFSLYYLTNSSLYKISELLIENSDLFLLYELTLSILEFK